jgi:hypothetical protein
MLYRHLGFTIDRLTMTTSVTCASWESDSPSRLARFSSELDLMPIRPDNLPDFGTLDIAIFVTGGEGNEKTANIFADCLTHHAARYPDNAEYSISAARFH